MPAQAADPLAPRPAPLRHAGLAPLLRVVVPAAVAEADDLAPLVDAKESQHAPGRQQRQVGVGAEPAVPHEQVTGRQQRVQQPRLGSLVDEEAERHHLDDQPGHGVEQAQHLGHRQPRALDPALGALEGRAERRRVAHGRAGADEQEGAMPAPAGQVVPAAAPGPQRLPQRRRTRAQQFLHRRQRQPHPRPAVRGGVDGQLGQVPQVARMAVLKFRTWSTNRWPVCTGPNFRSRQAWPASRRADSIIAGGRCGSRSALIRRSARETLAIRDLLWLGELQHPAFSQEVTACASVVN